MSFRKKVRNGLVGLVLLAGSSLIGGCAAQRARDAYNRGLVSYDAVLEAQNQDEALTLSLIGGGVAGLGAHKGKPEGIYVGRALSEHGAAMAGKSNVHQTVNVSPKNSYEPISVSSSNQDTRTDSYSGENEINRVTLRKNQPGFGLVTALSCNYCKDFDNNGILDFPDDFIGIKDRFRLNNKVTLAITSENETNIEINLYDLNGNLVKKTTKDSARFAAEEFEKLNAGDYTAVFYVNGNFVGRRDFVVEN